MSNYFYRRRNIASMTEYLVLITTVITVVLIRESTARELRPSDHGLEYQSLPPTGLKSVEMKKSFFGATSKSSSKPSTVALPKAMNSNDSWWRRRNGHLRLRLRQVLLLGSLICGVTGVALLAASATIYVIKIRSSSPPTKSSN